MNHQQFGNYKLQESEMDNDKMMKTASYVPKEESSAAGGKRENSLD